MKIGSIITRVFGAVFASLALVSLYARETETNFVDIPGSILDIYRSFRSSIVDILSAAFPFEIDAFYIDIGTLWIVFGIPTSIIVHRFFKFTRGALKTDEHARKAHLLWNALHIFMVPYAFIAWPLFAFAILLMPLKSWSKGGNVAVASLMTSIYFGYLGINAFVAFSLIRWNSAALADLAAKSVN